MAISEKVKEAFETTDVYEKILQALEYAGLVHEPEGGELPECVVEGILKLGEYELDESQARRTAMRHSHREIKFLKERHAADMAVLAKDRNDEIERRIVAERVAQEQYEKLSAVVAVANRQETLIDKLTKERKKNKRKK
jgi:hypothetical protein